MAFLHPEALWLALTLPAIVFFYLLRPRRRERPVPSILLWQQVAQELEANRPWQRLRPQFILWLQLLAAGLCALAAAGPTLRLAGPARNTIVLLDASASMQATDVAPSRFARALREVEAMAAGLRGGRLTVIAFDRQPRVVVNEARDAAGVRRALAGLKPSSAAGDVAPALSLAGALARRLTHPRLVLVSDGGLDFPANLPAGLEVITVGRSAANVSLAGLSLRSLGGNQVAQVSVVNHGDAAAKGRVNLYVNGRAAGSKAWQLPAHGATHLLWPDLPPGATVAAELEADDPAADYLAVDNRAWAVPQSGRRARALLVTTGNVYLERALSLLPGLEVYRATPEEYARFAAASYPYELTVWDGYADKNLPPGAVWIINPPPGLRLEGLEVGPAFRPHALVGADGSPVLRYVDLAEVHLEKAHRLTLAGGWTVDLAADGRPLLARRAEKGRRLAVLACDPQHSDLPLRPAFPVLVQNLATWLVPPALEVPQGRVGEELLVSPLPLAEKIIIEAPDGSVTELAPPFPPAPFRPAVPGLYHLVQRWANPERPGDTVEVRQAFAVNAYDVREAVLAPRMPGGSGEEGPVAGGPHGRRPPGRPVPLSSVLGLATLAVVLWEWKVVSRGR